MARRKRPERRNLNPGENFRDLVSSFLCSRGHVILNARHLSETPPPSPLTTSRADVRWLATKMTEYALAEFALDFTAYGDHSIVPSKLRLDRERLLDDMPGRARWVIERWDARKIEGRRRGGLTSRPKPKYVLGDLARWGHLPERERRDAAIRSGMSRATYYRLKAKYALPHDDLSDLLDD